MASFNPGSIMEALIARTNNKARKPIADTSNPIITNPLKTAIAKQPNPGKFARGVGRQDTEYVGPTSLENQLNSQRLSGASTSPETRDALKNAGQAQRDSFVDPLEFDARQQAVGDIPDISKKAVTSIERESEQLKTDIKNLYAERGDALRDANNSNSSVVRQIEMEIQFKTGQLKENNDILNVQGRNLQDDTIDVFGDSPETSLNDRTASLQPQDASGQAIPDPQQVRTFKRDQFTKLRPKAQDEDVVTGAERVFNKEQAQLQQDMVRAGISQKDALPPVGPPTQLRQEFGVHVTAAGKRLETNEFIQDVVNRIEEQFPEFNSQGRETGKIIKGREIKEHAGRIETNNPQGERTFSAPEGVPSTATTTLRKGGPDTLSEGYNPVTNKVEPPDDVPFDPSFMDDFRKDIAKLFNDAEAARDVGKYGADEAQEALEEIQHLDNILHGVETGTLDKDAAMRHVRLLAEDGSFSEGGNRAGAGLENTVLPDPFKEAGFDTSPNPIPLTDAEKIQRKQSTSGNVVEQVEPGTFNNESPFTMFDQTISPAKQNKLIQQLAESLKRKSLIKPPDPGRSNWVGGFMNTPADRAKTQARHAETQARIDKTRSERIKRNK